MSRWFHRHSWVEKARQFNPSPGGQARFINDQELMMFAFGATVVELRCEGPDGCGDIKAAYYPGKVTL